MVNDPIGDALIRIKNGYLASKLSVIVPYSKLNLAICQLLSQEGFIASAEKQENLINVTLKYESREPVLTDVKRISKPGLRVYKRSKELPRVLNGLGVAIVSTPKGIMTDKQARKKGVGGEIMALVW